MQRDNAAHLKLDIPGAAFKCNARNGVRAVSITTCQLGMHIQETVSSSVSICHFHFLLSFPYFLGLEPSTQLRGFMVFHQPSITSRRNFKPVGCGCRSVLVSRRVVLRTDDQTASFLRAPIYRLNNVNDLLFVANVMRHLVVVSRSEVH